MLHLVLVALFTAAGVVACAAASTGLRGQVCRRGVGYSVPDRVARDPQLDAVANGLVARWGIVSALVSFPPILVLLWDMQSSPAGSPPPTSWLLGFAIYGFVLVCVGGYPFAKINQLGQVSP